MAMSESSRVRPLKRTSRDLWSHGGMRGRGVKKVLLPREVEKFVERVV